jgi:hypothetical protein
MGAEAESRPVWWADQDDLLLSITEGRALDTRKLRVLPPWRAVMLGRVAQRAGLGLERGTLEQLQAEAHRVGRGGRLGEWWA